MPESVGWWKKRVLPTQLSPFKSSSNNFLKSIFTFFLLELLSINYAHGGHTYDYEIKQLQ